MLHYNTIEPATLELLRQLQDIPFLSNTRLVGGTSLALQIGHRKSIDIDLFGDDAEPEPMPYMLKEKSWNNIKEKILKEI